MLEEEEPSQLAHVHIVPFTQTSENHSVSKNTLPSPRANSGSGIAVITCDLPSLDPKVLYNLIISNIALFAYTKEAKLPFLHWEINGKLCCRPSSQSEPTTDLDLQSHLLIQDSILFNIKMQCN